MKQRLLQSNKEKIANKLHQHMARNTERLNSIIENKTVRLLLFVFCGSILSKIFLIPSMGAIWFPYSDEHLYIELAKSFYFHHNFASNLFFYIKQFNEILFPLLLSPLYAFYSPDNILSVFRIYGLIMMSMAVFPAYKLSLTILKNKKQALLISIITVLLPEMTLAFSVVQEVIYFPLFLFTIYIIYKTVSGIRVNPIFLGFLFFLLWSCKAIGATVFVSYIFYLCCELVIIDKFKHYKSYVVHILVVIVTVFGLKVLLSLVIRYVNYGSFEAIGDFWTSTALSRLFTALSDFISNFSNGIAYYLFFVTMIFMIFPLVLPIDNLDQYELKDRKFILFLMTSLVITIVTVVILIYTAEGGTAVEAQRVHYRYIFPYFIPFLIMMLKLDFTRLKIRLVGLLYLAFIVIYYLLFRPKFTIGSIIDAKSLLLIETIQNKTINSPALIFLLVTIALIFLGYILYKKVKKFDTKIMLFWLIGIALVINQAYAIHYTYLNYTVFTNGITRKNEYSTLSKLMDSRPGTPILLNMQSGMWLDVLYTAQSNKDLIAARRTKNPLEFFYEPHDEQNFLITTKNVSGVSKIQNTNLLNTDLTLFNVFEFTNNPDGLIKFEYLLQDTYADNWLKDDSVLLIAGIEGNNQIEVTISLNTAAQATNIGAILTDSTGQVFQVPVSPNGKTVTLLFNKNPEEQNFKINFSSNNYFVPAELGINDDTRRLTYYISNVEVK